MKIGKLEQHCGNCAILDYCAEPFSELCICTCKVLEEIEEEDYIKAAEEIQSKNKRHISNNKMFERICRKVGKGR